MPPTQPYYSMGAPTILWAIHNEGIGSPPRTLMYGSTSADGSVTCSDASFSPATFAAGYQSGYGNGFAHAFALLWQRDPLLWQRGLKFYGPSLAYKIVVVGDLKLALMLAPTIL